MKKKYLTFEPMDQFSSVIPFWKPQNVSFLPRRGGPGPPAPPLLTPLTRHAPGAAPSHPHGLENSLKTTKAGT